MENVGQQLQLQYLLFGPMLLLLLQLPILKQPTSVCLNEP